MGEAAPLPPWTEPAEACLAALRGARAAVDRDEPVAVDDLPPAAAHALSLAVADATARRDGRPLAASLAAEAGLDAPATAVPVNATVGDGSVDETVAAAEAAVADGFDCLKCKVGARGVAEDVDRLRAVRDAVGDAVGLRADANGAWRREEAERAVDALGGVALEYLEQPVAAGDHGALRALRGRGVPIAVDEAVNAPSGAEGWPDPVEDTRTWPSSSRWRRAGRGRPSPRRAASPTAASTRSSPRRSTPPSHAPPPSTSPPRSPAGATAHTASRPAGCWRGASSTTTPRRSPTDGSPFRRDRASRARRSTAWCEPPAAGYADSSATSTTPTMPRFRWGVQ
ncbi:enolase C-terminal domain-like protein [Halobaculum litoreum]|uniref:enolase C-terminal domain-like protein n=1 Tax=Halobaculum litoreum TaxID=3031998 RepID=UPI002AA2B4A9|nr:enolase C-terminal domain-like protein [Halobaculum sp. DT92]